MSSWASSVSSFPSRRMLPSKSRSLRTLKMVLLRVFHISTLYYIHSPTYSCSDRLDSTLGVCCMAQDRRRHRVHTRHISQPRIQRVIFFVHLQILLLILLFFVFAAIRLYDCNLLSTLVAIEHRHPWQHRCKHYYLLYTLYNHLHPLFFFYFLFAT